MRDHLSNVDDKDLVQRYHLKLDHIKLLEGKRYWMLDGQEDKGRLGVSSGVPWSRKIAVERYNLYATTTPKMLKHGKPQTKSKGTR